MCSGGLCHIRESLFHPLTLCIPPFLSSYLPHRPIYLFHPSIISILFILTLLDLSHISFTLIALYLPLSYIHPTSSLLMSLFFSHPYPPPLPLITRLYFKPFPSPLSTHYHLSQTFLSSRFAPPFTNLPSLSSDHFLPSPSFSLRHPSLSRSPFSHSFSLYLSLSLPLSLSLSLSLSFSLSHTQQFLALLHLLYYTPQLIHPSPTPLTYTPHLHPSPTLLTYTPHIFPLASTPFLLPFNLNLYISPGLKCEYQCLNIISIVHCYSHRIMMSKHKEERQL